MSDLLTLPDLASKRYVQMEDDAWTKGWASTKRDVVIRLYDSDDTITGLAFSVTCYHEGKIRYVYAPVFLLEEADEKAVEFLRGREIQEDPEIPRREFRYR